LKVQISPLMGFERNFWPNPELMQGILAWSMDPRVTGPDPDRYKYEYVPAIGFTTSQAARNHICDLFLDHSDCDYLIMIDNDMKPIHPVTHELANVMHLPAMGLPIVAAPTAVMKGLNWFINGYIRDYEDGWRAMSLEELQRPVEPLETEWGPAVMVDSAGFGCVCIRRDVLEAVRESGIDFVDAGHRVGQGSTNSVMSTGQRFYGGPKVAITRNRNPRGETDCGEDMLFGRRAQELGYQSYMAPACIMGHYHTVDLTQMTGLVPSLTFPDYGIKGPHPMPNDYSISLELAEYLRQLVRGMDNPFVLELGAGISTFVLAEMAQAVNGGLLFSVEEDKKQSDRILALLRKNSALDRCVTIYHAELDEDGFYSDWPSKGIMLDLILVDGPSGQHQSRGQASRYFHMLVDGGYVILDDTHRPYEASVVVDWCKKHDLRVVREIVSGNRKSTVMRLTG
jgi:predicted O-methyltransferase YrrM